MKMVLTGHYAGRTMVINGFPFTEGECVLKGELASLDGAIRYLATYNAFPAGSSELEQAQFRDMENGGDNGGSSNQDGPEDGANNSGKHSDEPIAPVTPNGAGHDAVEADALRGGAAPSGDGGSSGRDSDPRTLQIVDALNSLDPSVDDHWTDGGLPRVAAIEAASGIVGITRKEIEAAYKDFDREKAAASAV